MLIYFSDADEDLVMEIFIKVPAIIFGFLCATCIGKGFLSFIHIWELFLKVRKTKNLSKIEVAPINLIQHGAAYTTIYEKTRVLLTILIYQNNIHIIA